MRAGYTLITGGTTGIGYQAAKQLINDSKQVIITGKDEKRVYQAATALGCKGIVTDAEKMTDINQLAEKLIAQDITLEGLVLNAGIFVPEYFADTTEAIYEQTMAINTKGPFFTLKALLPVMQHPSSVVFISSIVVAKGFETCAAYAASKAAGEAFIRVANIELASRRIRLNTIRPGITQTPIQQKAGMSVNDTQALFDSLKSTPLGRVLHPTDLAGAISFLLSDASMSIRNAIISVDGGYCL